MRINIVVVYFIFLITCIVLLNESRAEELVIKRELPSQNLVTKSEDISDYTKSDNLKSSRKELNHVQNKKEIKYIKDGKPIAGWIEEINIAGSKAKVKAKLDSGANTSSIDADIIKIYDKDNKKYIIYRINMSDKKQETFESVIVRWVRIKTKTGKFIRRPVVKMDFCIADKLINDEVNLADRAHFLYPVLIGRNMMQNNVLIDVSKKFITTPRCNM